MNRECLFCKMAWKEVSVETGIYEDDKVMAFLDIHPRAPGHALVIPKYHAATLGELPEPEILPLFSAVQRVAQAITGRLGAHGITIGINQGKAAGQEVDHLHVHLLPRWEEDGGGSVQGIVNNAPKESLAQIAKKLHING